MTLKDKEGEGGRDQKAKSSTDIESKAMGDLDQDGASNEPSRISISSSSSRRPRLDGKV